VRSDPCRASSACVVSVRSRARCSRDRVTFSGTARPSNAIVDLRLRAVPSPSKSRRRERRR
jgi:hypothetical protein